MSQRLRVVRFSVSPTHRDEAFFGGVLTAYITVSYTARMSGQVIGAGVAGAITQSFLSRNLKELIKGPDAEKVRRDHLISWN